MRNKNQNNNKVDKSFQHKEWILEDTLEKGRIRIEITSSRNHRGNKIYSISIYKKVLDREGNPVLDHNNKEKRTRFFRLEELNIITDLCKEVRHWIDADRHEDQQTQSTKNIKRSYV